MQEIKTIERIKIKNVVLINIRDYGKSKIEQWH